MSSLAFQKTKSQPCNGGVGSTGKHAPNSPQKLTDDACSLKPARRRDSEIYSSEGSHYPSSGQSDSSMAGDERDLGSKVYQAKAVTLVKHITAHPAGTVSQL